MKYVWLESSDAVHQICRAESCSCAGVFDTKKAVLKPSWLDNVNDKAKEINDEFVNGLRIEKNEKRQSW